MLATLGSTYRNASAWLSTGLIASMTFVITIWLQQWSLLATFWELLPTLAARLQFAWILLGNFGTSLTFLGQFGTITIALLLGINITLLVRYVRERRSSTATLQQHGSRNLGALIAGIFGIGCAACGTALLGTILALFGATGALALLPLHGQEFTLLSVLLLLWATGHLLRELGKPLTCPTP